MGVTADSVVVELEAKLAKYESDVTRGAKTFDNSMSTMERSAAQAEAKVQSSAQAMGVAVQKAANDTEQSARRSANATRNLGRQVSDIGVGLAGGQSPFLILAQQAPQVADALADTGGKAAKVAMFFAGPWGAALLAAGSIVGVLAGKLLEEGDASDKAKKAAQEHAAAVERLNEIAGITAHTEEQRAAATLAVARADLQAAKAAEARAQAQLNLIGTLQARPDAVIGQGALGLAIVGGRATEARDKARDEVRVLQGKIDRAASERVLADYADMFPLGKTRFGKLVQSGGSTTPTPVGGARGGGRARAPSGPSLADRLKADAEGGGSYISSDLSAAGSDANALKLSLDTVDQSLAAIRTGLEGVDIGSILTEDEQHRLEQFADSFRQDLASGLTDALISGRNLGDVLEDSFKRAAAALVQSGITDLLSGNKFGSSFGAGGIGSAIKSVTGSLFGRASGGYVAPGQMVRVNEGASPGRVEGFMSPQGGKIVPLGRMNKAGGGSVSTTVNQSFDLRGAMVDRDVYRDIEQIASAKSAQAAVAGRVGAGDDVRQAVRRSLPRSAG